MPEDHRGAPPGVFPTRGRNATGHRHGSWRKGHRTRHRWPAARWAAVAGIAVVLGLAAACATPLAPAQVAIGLPRSGDSAGTAAPAAPPDSTATTVTTSAAGRPAAGTPERASPTARPAPSATPASSAAVSRAEPTPPAATNTAAAAPSATPASGALAPGERVTAVGDSILLGASASLQQAIESLGGNLDADAEVGRQVQPAVEILRARRDAGQLGQVVLVGIGTNGTFSERQFAEIMQIVEGVRRVIFVNNKMPRAWEDPNNAMLAGEVKRYANAVLVDWHAASIDHPEFFGDDQIHPRPAGVQAYVDLVMTALEAP